MDTLECPVCLDTADTPPVYQCPEGHLICKGGLITLNLSYDLTHYPLVCRLQWEDGGVSPVWPRSHERQEQVGGGVKLRLRASCCCCRTAELLAVKLNQLRGDTVKTVMASQALNITVRNGPQLFNED